MDDLMHVIEFSHNNQLLAYIDETGKLKIWDTETKKLRQEYVPNLHLASPITCMKWIEVAMVSVLKFLLQCWLFCTHVACIYFRLAPKKP